MRQSIRQAMLSAFAGASALVIASTASAHAPRADAEFKSASQPEVAAQDEEAEIQMADLGDRLAKELLRNLQRSARKNKNTERGPDGLRYRERSRRIGDPSVYHQVTTDRRLGTSQPNNRGTRSPRDDYRVFYNGYGEWTGTCKRDNATRETCYGPAFGAPVR